MYRLKRILLMPPIPQATIDRVLEATDIVELIGSFIALKKLGQSFVGLCPFHEDKSPSLSVSPEKKIFRCFGCGTNGNAITFLRKHKNLPFPEAVRVLATRAKLSLAPERDSNREPLLLCLAKAQEEFSKQLRSGTYRSPVNYLTERGTRPDIQEEFGLGYAGSIKDLIVALKKAGIGKKEIPLGAGVLKEKDQGVTCPFMGRIIFPLTDQKGVTVGFGGRAIDGSAQAKYLNSSDSSIFNKRKILFGLKQLQISNDTVLVVEGYFDVLTLHQAGFKNTVALLGTEITSEQSSMLATLAREIILIFDGDAGGRAALLKALRLSQPGSSVKAVSLPEGYDPDQYIREGNVAELEALIEKAKPVQDAAIEIITGRKETEGTDSLTDEVVRLATAIADPLEASRFAQQAAAALQLSAWAMDEKVQARREKKERIGERKRQLEEFLVSELIAKPDLFPSEKLESIKDIFDDHEQKQILLTQILKHA